MNKQTNELLRDVVQRLVRLEHEAELMRTVLTVKEPDSVLAAGAYDGLRKQIVAAAAERRSHMVQLATMAVAVRRARSVDDLVPQVHEWMAQAGVTELSQVPPGWQPQDLFEDLDGDGLAGAEAVEVVEPAYVDAATNAVLRLGRARRWSRRAGPAPVVAGIDGVAAPDELTADELTAEERT